MTAMQITALALMAVFYFAYFTKMNLQRKKGIQTDQIGKGKKQKSVLVIEILMKAGAYGIVPVEIVSIMGKYQMWNGVLCWLGITVSGFGVLLFILAMAAMRDNWRAGIPESDKTELVTTGIYSLSRNPAFVGFDLMYIGLLAAFFNPVHLFFALYTVIMLHLQILQEEKFLIGAFGDDYLEYMKRTGRYLFWV